MIPGCGAIEAGQAAIVEDLDNCFIIPRYIAL